MMLSSSLEHASPVGAPMVGGPVFILSTTYLESISCPYQSDCKSAHTPYPNLSATGAPVFIQMYHDNNPFEI